ncbi:DUF1353 domain-containing protein [Hymenobacter sp. UV11]|nr:DUF1353 domain-containing protein [Hymenobacter sp. UV11]
MKTLLSSALIYICATNWWPSQIPSILGTNATLLPPTAFNPWPLPVHAATNGSDDVSFRSCSYIDPNGYKWTAPVGTITDGASIPTICLSFVGDRRDERWRGASLLHDAYCGKANSSGNSYHKATWQKVNRMFYNACLAGGTPQAKAAAMYSAVWLFNKRWTYLDNTSPEYLAALSRAGGSTLSENTSSAVANLAKMQASQVVISAQKVEIKRLDVNDVSATLKIQQIKEVVDYAKADSLTLPRLDSILVAASQRLKTGNVLVLPGQ